MAIIIKSNKEGFFRCGIPHSKEPVSYPDDRFTEDELERLMNEPKLSVNYIPEAGASTTKETSIEDTETVVSDPEKNAPVAGDRTGTREPEMAQDVLEAARQTVAAGNTIQSGAPDIKAMEQILGRDVDAAMRDRAWNLIQAETKE